MCLGRSDLTGGGEEGGSGKCCLNYTPRDDWQLRGIEGGAGPLWVRGGRKKYFRRSKQHIGDSESDLCCSPFPSPSVPMGSSVRLQRKT